jgi:hypothetical protein
MAKSSRFGNGIPSGSENPSGGWQAAESTLAILELVEGSEELSLGEIRPQHG